MGREFVAFGGLPERLCVGCVSEQKGEGGGKSP